MTAFSRAEDEARTRHL